MQLIIRQSSDQTLSNHYRLAELLNLEPLSAVVALIVFANLLFTLIK